MNRIKKIADIEPGDHICHLYKTKEEHRAIIMPFLRQGLERGEKVIYIVDTPIVEPFLGYLQDNGGDAQLYLTRGQLKILGIEGSYMREGVFDPDRTINMLRAETEKALAEGYLALRVTGEMTWALKGLPGSGRLIEYEKKVNQFLIGSKCSAICQYDRRRFHLTMLLDVIANHPVAAIGTEIFGKFLDATDRLLK